MNRVKIIFVLTGCMLLFSCSEKKAPPTPPVPVNIITVKAQTVVYYDNYPGTVQALSQVSLLPEVQGYITSINFIEGSHIQKGQVLYEIDKRIYQAAYDQAVANQKVAKNNLDQAQQDADRYTYLNKQDAVARQTYDHAVIALEVAKNSLTAAEQAVNTAKANFTYAVINAPFDGTIGFSQVKLGNMVVAGQTVLNTISTDDPMAVDFLINEAQLSRYENIKTGKGPFPDSLFTLILPDHSLYPYTGKISVIDRWVDPQTGTIRIRIEFRNPKYSLRAGMSCIVRVRNIDAKPQMIIPNKAVIEQMGEYFVFIVKDTLVVTAADSLHKETADTVKSPKMRAYQKKIMLGATIDDKVIVKSGITEGDSVVVDGVQALHEGSKVALGSKTGEGKNRANRKKKPLSE